MDTLEQAAQRFRLALEQHQAGHLPQAEKLYREALALAPDRVSVLVNLAAVLVGQQRFAEALRHCERALAIDPKHADALQNAALCRMQLFADDEALALTERALALDPHGIAALNNHGVALRDRGRVEEALGCFDQAVAIRAEVVGLRCNRGSALFLLSRMPQAVADFVAALRLDPEFHPAQRGLYELLGSPAAREMRPDDEVVSLAIRATVESWGRPQALAPFLIASLRRRPEFDALIAPLEHGAGSPDFTPASMRALCGSRVLSALLENCLVPDPAIERLLTALRAELLHAAWHEDGYSSPDPARLSLHCALARQCFINDYLYPASEDERDSAARLRARLKAAPSPPPAWIAACASYAPLGIGLDGERLLAHAWPEPVAHLLRQQISEPAQERSLAAGIGSLTTIEDPTSVQVRRQYEAHPYPRWVSLPARPDPQSFSAYLSSRIPGLKSHEVPRATQITALNAGCGTGQHPIETAQALAGSEVLAVDLSKASLAYAKRMAQQLGVGNLRFAQADILSLGGRGLRFDLIESSGVLHHLADPLRGLAILVDLLHRDGVMRLGLYSERGREAVVLARKYIAAQGYASDAAGIRACRRAILQLPPDSPLRGVLGFNDFYSVSECRDLLFHVQEHRFTLAGVAAALAKHKLELLGFELDAARRTAFASMFPDPAAQRDLSAWDRFESRFPDAFANMYQFWVRKQH